MYSTVLYCSVQKRIDADTAAGTHAGRGVPIETRVLACATAARACAAARRDAAGGETAAAGYCTVPHCTAQYR